MKYLFVFIALLQCAFTMGQMHLNTAFGGGGILKASLDDFTEPVEIISLADDTLLLLSNVTDTDTGVDADLALIKLSPDGATDPSFGIGGIVRKDFNGMDNSYGNSVIALDDSKILVVGTGHSIGNPNFIPACLMRLLPNGKTDSTFGTNGTLDLQFNAIEEFPRVLKKVSNGKIMVGGFSTDTMHMHVDVPAIARLNEDGTFDQGFGDYGKTYLRFPNGIISATRHTIGGVLYDVMELNDGSYLACGGYSNALNLIAYISHLKSNGEVDTTFFNSGYLAIDFTPLANSQIVRMKQQANGLVWFAATSTSTQDKDFFTGSLNMSNSDYNVSPIDIDGMEDIVGDVELYNGNPFYVGRSILASHSSSVYTGDYFSVSYTPSATYPFNTRKFTFSDDTTRQCGAVSSVLQSNGDLICYGFQTDQAGRSQLMLISVDVLGVSAIVDAEEIQSGIQVYPNPSTGIVNVSLSDAGNATEFALLDAVGNELIRSNFTDRTSSFDLSQFASGLYFCKVISGNKQYFSRIVKQ